MEEVVWATALVLVVAAVMTCISIGVVSTTHEHRATVTSCLNAGRSALECKQLR